MKNRILAFVTERHNEKREQRKVPHYITFREINERLGGVDKQLLRELVREKQLEWGKTINDVWFAPKYEPITSHTTAEIATEAAEISNKIPLPNKDIDELISALK